MDTHLARICDQPFLNGQAQQLTYVDSSDSRENLASDLLLARFSLHASAAPQVVSEPGFGQCVPSTQGCLQGTMCS
jgi:hypothetical protein